MLSLLVIGFLLMPFNLRSVNLANVYLNGNIILINWQIGISGPIALAARAFFPALHPESLLISGPEVLETVGDVLIKLHR